MIDPLYVKLMSTYTSWQNRSIYAAADTLTAAERQAHKGAFFGSIHATLSHLLWGDELWLHRLAGTPAPAVPDIPNSVAAYADWEGLCEARAICDAKMRAWSERVTAAELNGTVSWFSGAMQRDMQRPTAVCVVQLFNHGTHHRGQVHALLTQAGARPDDTDVPFMPVADEFWQQWDPPD